MTTLGRASSFDSKGLERRGRAAAGAIDSSCKRLFVMSELKSDGNPLSTDEREDLVEYRPINAPAVVGLICGLASILAFVHPLLWLLPALGTVISLWALRSLAIAAPEQLGRKAALIGLTLSLTFGAAAPTQMAIFCWRLRVETQQLAKQWFEALREGNPYLANQFTRTLGGRVKPDDDLLVRYAEPEERHHLSKYVEEPAVRMLLSLGKYAQVRYFANEILDPLDSEPAVIDVYAVSVRHKGQTTSCFVRLTWRWNIEYGTNERCWVLKAAVLLPKPLEGWNPPG